MTTTTEETKILYHLDDQETPYLVKVNIAPGQITLRDLKQALKHEAPTQQTRYKYFFKSMDSDFGVVKEEVLDDNAHLPQYNGRVIAYLSTIAESVRSSSKHGGSQSSLGVTNNSQSNISCENDQQHQQEDSKTPMVVGGRLMPSFIYNNNDRKSQSSDIIYERGRAALNSLENVNAAIKHTNSLYQQQNNMVKCDSSIRNEHVLKHGLIESFNNFDTSNTETESLASSFNSMQLQQHKQYRKSLKHKNHHRRPANTKPLNDPKKISKMMHDALASIDYDDDDEAKELTTDNETATTTTTTTTSDNTTFFDEITGQTMTTMEDDATTTTTTTDDDDAFSSITTDTDVTTTTEASTIYSSRRYYGNELHRKKRRLKHYKSHGDHRHHRHHHNHHHHQNHYQMDRASSMSSLTDSVMSLDIITVVLNMDKANFLGISIVGQNNKVQGEGGIYVSTVMQGGAVQQDGRIQAGDMILQVNDISFEHMSNDEAVKVLRNAVMKHGPVKLVVAKCWNPNPMPQQQQQQQQPFALSRKEPVCPIDPKEWLTKTAQHQQRLSHSISTFGSNSSLASSFMTDDTQTLYDDTNAGQTTATTATTMADLTVDTDMEYVVRYMASEDSGLEVCDRSWLKMHIHNAFIGHDVVEWLFHHVDGFVDRRDARKYAANLLYFGYIRHPVVMTSKTRFSEQCYYVFSTDFAQCTLLRQSMMANGMGTLAEVDEEEDDDETATVSEFVERDAMYHPIYQPANKIYYGTTKQQQPQHLPSCVSSSSSSTTTSSGGHQIFYPPMSAPPPPPHTTLPYQQNYHQQQIMNVSNLTSFNNTTATTTTASTTFCQQQTAEPIYVKKCHNSSDSKSSSSQGSADTEHLVKQKRSNSDTKITSNAKLLDAAAAAAMAAANAAQVNKQRVMSVGMLRQQQQGTTFASVM